MLKPLDLQIIMPRTIDIQRIQQTQNSRPMVDQQETLREAVKQSHERQEQVLQNEAASEGGRIHDDNDNDAPTSERHYRRYNRRKKPNSKEQEPEPVEDSRCGQHIDIKM